MTKKHFIALADVIRNHNNSASYLGIKKFDGVQLESLALFCKQQNPRFNRERWMAYIAGECGPNGGRK